MADAPRILRVDTSFAALPEASAMRRRPRAPWRPRPAAFWQAFEDRALWYDAFRDVTGRDVLLVGPAPLNLRAGLAAARYRALPSGDVLRASVHPSRSTMITRLADVPPDTHAIAVEAFGAQFTLPVQPGHCAELAGAKILFAINRDNQLDWIADWAGWHAVLHGTDTVLLFDNGSTRYGLPEIEQALAAVPGLARIAVVSLPHKFGPIDPSVLMTRFYPRFLQITMVQIALRRFGMLAAGMINCDIDELAWAGGPSLYERVAASPLGALRMRGRWIEAVRAPDAPVRHASFSQRFRDARHRLSPSKWVLDPRRDWVRPLSVQPYLHRIHGAPDAARTHDEGALFFHFKGINTNWKENRTATAGVDASRLVADEALAAARARLSDAPAQGQS